MAIDEMGYGTQNVLDLLLEQHQAIKTLFERVKSPTEPRRRELFDELVLLLAVHESAEEQVVHPAARRTDAGSQVVERRFQEESQAKRDLSALCELGVEHPEFDEKLALLAAAMLEHAEREETEEFTWLLRQTQPEALVRMAGAVRAAEAAAPTRPHPLVGESQLANVVAGPPLAVFDRVRDAVRTWFRSNGT